MSFLFIQELKRRNVFKVASVYVITSWLILQIISVLVPYLRLPDVFGSIVTVMLIIGFPLICIFAWAFELTPEGVKLTQNVDRNMSITDQTGNKLDRWLMVCLVLAVGYIAYEKMFTYQIDDSKELSIAILPFKDMSAEQNQAYFADGIAEEILNSLARIKQLQVISRTSSFQFKNNEQDIRRIGDLLGANYILEGSVRKDKRNLRITAQLVDSQSGTHIWSDTYDRQVSDIFLLQDELTYSITQALKLNLIRKDIKNEYGMTDNEDAYNLFLKGRELGYQRNSVALNQAAKYLEQAIKLDPKFALAKAQLFIVTALSLEHGNADVPYANQLMKKLFYELLAFEQDFPLKTLVIGKYIELVENNHELSAVFYRKAAKNAPSDSIVQNWYLINLTSLKGVHDVIKAREAFYKINPLDVINISNLIDYHNWLNNRSAAEYYTNRLLTSAPEHSMTALAMLEKLFLRDKQPKKALEYIQKFDGDMSAKSKQIYIELLLVTGNIEQAIIKLNEYIGDNQGQELRFAPNIINLIHVVNSGSYARFSLVDIQKQLDLSEDFYEELILAEKALTGDWKPFVAYWDRKAPSYELFSIQPESMLKFMYAMIKYQMGDSQYIKHYKILRYAIGTCVESEGRIGEACPLILKIAGENDLNNLFKLAKNHLLSGVSLGFEGSKRYILTSPHLYMVREHPDFKPVAEEYLNETYRKWEKEFAAID